MSEYSDKVIEHFEHPRNLGILEDAQGVGEIGNSDCGDFIKVFIKAENGMLTDVKYQIRGCPASVACASVMTELAIGKNIDDALMLNDMDIVDALDGLPESKMRCPAFCISGFQKAVADYSTCLINKCYRRRLYDREHRRWIS